MANALSNLSLTQLKRAVEIKQQIETLENQLSQLSGNAVNAWLLEAKKRRREAPHFPSEAFTLFPFLTFSVYLQLDGHSGRLQTRNTHLTILEMVFSSKINIKNKNWGKKTKIIK